MEEIYYEPFLCCVYFLYVINYLDQITKVCFVLLLM
jgi:hypothetical protein